MTRRPEVGFKIFGRAPEGDVIAASLDNGRGMKATFLTYGATLQSLLVADRSGVGRDVVLGHRSIEDYAVRQFMGSTVGRFANRIAHGRFMLDGTEHCIVTNDGAHALHGGAAGLDRHLWTIADSGSDAEQCWVSMRCRSDDGDQGFPGTLDVEARFSLTISGSLAIDYHAWADRPTLVNITLHPYWNLAGEDSGADVRLHELSIAAESYLPVDQGLIPLGFFCPVASTAFDFRRSRPIGRFMPDSMDDQMQVAGGYDHNWVISREAPAAEQLMASLRDPSSGLGFELWSNQPGLQFYSGNFLDGSTKGKQGRSYERFSALVLEPQAFPDAPNRPGIFPSARLDPGETYHNHIRYQFGITRP